MQREQIVADCRMLLEAYHSGQLGYTKMPEDSSPTISDDEQELRLAYFTLPMSLNYQRDSYKLWESALKTYSDSETREVFDIKAAANLDETRLRQLLTRHKLALQPNKHVATWQKISKTINDNWGSIGDLILSSGYDFIRLRELVQKKHKQGFPYLSGPKIFNYWSFIIQEYGKIKLANSDYIEIAPDTHITKCSVLLGVITKEESETLSRQQISERWRQLLQGTGINPIDMHPPLWFWSRNSFQYKLPKTL